MESVTISNRNLADIAKSIDAKLAEVPKLLRNLIKNAENGTNVPSCNSIHHIISSSTSSPCYVSHGADRSTTSNFTRVLRPILNNTSIYRQFLFDDNVQFVYPAEFLSANANIRLHWRDYLNAITLSKHVILLVGIDHDTSLSQLETFKAVLKHLVEMSGDDDFYQLIIAGNDGENEKCGNLKNDWMKMDLAGKSRMGHFIDNIRLPLNETGGSLHLSALSIGMKALRDSKNDNINPTIQYISRGILSELSESSQIMAKFAEDIKSLPEKKRSFKLNSIIVMDENRSPIPLSEEFFSNLVEFNYFPYVKSVDNVTIEELEQNGEMPQKGELIFVSQRSITSALNLTVLQGIHAQRMNEKKKLKNDSIKWSVSRNQNGKDVITLTKLVSDSTVVGVDLLLSQIADDILVKDILELSPSKADIRLMVANFDRLILASSDSQVDIRLDELDQWDDSFSTLVDAKMKRPQEGEFSLKQNQKRISSRTSYVWKKLKSAPFIVIMSYKDDALPTTLERLPEYTRQRFSLNNLVWHEFEDDKYAICSSFRNTIAPRLASVYLAPRSYRLFIRHSLLPNIVRNNWVYLTDSIGYIRSNSLRSGVREDVGILSQLANSWMKVNSKTKGYNSVIRRYAATSRGAMVVYPATGVKNDYDPTTQKWFTAAMQSPGSIVLTGPIRDPNVGDLITLSYAVKSDNSSNSLLVIAMDFPSTFLSIVLNEAIPSCGKSKRCILFTSTGSVVYSDDKSEQARTLTDAIERFHFNHLEPMLATLMIRSGKVVKKMECATETSMRRFYEWNTNYTRVFTVQCGEASSTRMVGPLHSETLFIQSTNLFLSMVNSSCNRAIAGAFCPCSVKGKRCLLCSRFDSSDCECPCECSRQSACQSEQHLDRCPIEHSIESFIPPPMPISHEKKLASCGHIDCSQLLNPSSCRSTAGCEWCRFSFDGTPNSMPFCSAISSCYQGVQKRTVMKSNSDSEISLDDISFSIPLGPFLACILTITIFVLLIFWYRKLMRRLVERRPFDASGVALFSRHGQNSYEFDHDGSLYREAEKMALQLASFETEPPEVSRRQPPATVSSDHGYSTMTERNTADGSDCCATTGGFHEPRRSPNVSAIDQKDLKKISLDPETTTTSSVDESSQSADLIVSVS
ncbi:hypothetical protein WR25_12461 [Diploscapter pachys]|uniref:VWFA domain-containing protein n=1 Tax=Diploscapter pachys TaxID=2018661 RepID=A0A2A2KU81_9BILA|nr:hypothetical protein WR25_12461 [Diploscapter pachys]